LIEAPNSEPFKRELVVRYGPNTLGEVKLARSIGTLELVMEPPYGKGSVPKIIRSLKTDVTILGTDPSTE